MNGVTVNQDRESSGGTTDAGMEGHQGAGLNILGFM